MGIPSTFAIIFRKYFIYLLLERGREGEREGEKQPLVAPHLDPDQDEPTTQVCALKGIEPMTFWCMGQCSSYLSPAHQGCHHFLSI